LRLVKSKLLNVGVFKDQLERNLNKDGSLPLAPFKKTIKNALEELRSHQNQGVSAPELVAKYTWMMDKLVTIVWEHCASDQDDKISVELLAVGGYGRAELHPFSDIDLLILLKENLYDDIQSTVEPFLRFLWDIGLEVGHSVRSSKDCLKEARDNITIMTNLLEGRHLSGDSELFTALDDKLRNGRIWTPDRFFSGKFEEQRLRHHQYQNYTYSLEPNIKENLGGMRDLHMILWVYNRHYGVKSFKEMHEHGLIDDSEYRLLVRARNIVWKMRIGLHLITNRHEDRLMFDAQRQLAEEFGYQDTKSHLAVEQLMKRYYSNVQHILYLNEVLLEHYRISNSGRLTSLSRGRHLDDNFDLKNKLIGLREPDLFSKDPVQILKLFVLMQEHKIDGIHPDTIRAIRSNLEQINHQFRSNPNTKALFLEIFKDKGIGLTNVLARMNSYGVLGAYLPAFGSIVGQMQHDLFHVYTVDGHTLMVLKNLTSLREHPDEFPMASEILNDLYKPERLFIGALFHDIAKGRGGDHSELGEVDAYDFCIDHGMSEYDAKLVGWLVLRHLMMSHFSQRRDISDPAVIKDFADIVGDKEHLDNLYLLTLADIRGTSPKVWNAWKGQLLLELYNATLKALRQGVATPMNIVEHIADDQQAAMALLTEQLGENNIDEEQVRQFWSTLPSEYYIRNEPYYIAWHASSLLQASGISIPLVSIRYSERLEGIMIFVFAPETRNLFTQVTAAFDDLDLNILEARLQSSKNGFALYSFRATVPEAQSAQKISYTRSLEKQLRSLILKKKSTSLIRRRSASRALKHFPIEPEVSFSFNHPAYTTVDVVAQDQLGLLHNVAFILQENDLYLVSARVATFGARAEDIFFVRQHDHTPVTDEAKLAKLGKEICAALDRRTAAEKRKATLKEAVG